MTTANKIGADVIVHGGRIATQDQQRPQGACLDFGIQLLRESEDHQSRQPACSGTAMNTSPARTIIGSSRFTQPLSRIGGHLIEITPVHKLEPR